MELLVKRPEGNVLIDSPRFASQLVKRIEEMGGVARMLLTHKDDIAAHESFRARFGTMRTMHRADGASEITNRTGHRRRGVDCTRRGLVSDTDPWPHSRSRGVSLQTEVSVYR
jgi:hypothetical protein